MRYVISSDDNYGKTHSEIRSIKSKAPSQLDEMLNSIRKRVGLSARLLKFSNKFIVSSSTTHLDEDHNSSLLHDEHTQTLRRLHKRFACHVYTYSTCNIVSRLFPRKTKIYQPLGPQNTPFIVYLGIITTSSSRHSKRVAQNSTTIFGPVSWRRWRWRILSWTAVRELRRSVI